MTAPTPGAGRQQNPRRRAQMWLAALVAGLVGAALLAWAAPAAWPLTVEVGDGRDARFVRDFHAPEENGAIWGRWTRPRSELALPQPPAGPQVLSLRIVNSYPDGVPDPRVAVAVGGQGLGSFAIPREPSRLRLYHLLAPARPGADWAMRVIVEGSTFTPAGDRRDLGVLLDWARLAPTRAVSPVPALWILGAAFVLPALLTLLLVLLGAGPVAAAAVAAGVGALVAAGARAAPLEVLPFVPRLAALPAIGLLGLLFAHALTPVRTDQGTPRVAGEHLPALLAVGWWLPTFFQAVLIVDGVGIGVGPETLVLGMITTALLLVALIAAIARGRGLPAEGRKALIARYALAALALGAAIHLTYAIGYAFTRSGKDFWILFRGARDWARGGSFYDLGSVEANHVGAVFKVPPFYGMLFVPFTSLDGLQVLFYHRVLNVGLMLATALVWLRMLRPRPLWWGLAVLAILLNGRPLADTIAFGQIDLMLLFLLTCALWAMRAERDGLAGALIALGALFKIYPVILLAFFVLKGRWRGVLGFALGMLVANGVAVLAVGWEMHRVYLFEVVPRIGGTTSWVENQTISGFLARLADRPFEAGILASRPLSLLGTALSALVSLLACWLTLRPARGDSTTFALQYSQYLLLMVLAVPAAWMHYQTLLILPFSLLLVHLREREVGLGRALALALSFGLIFYGNQWSFNGTTVMGALTILGISYKFYGMLLLGALIVGALREERTPIELPALPRLWTSDDRRPTTAGRQL